MVHEELETTSHGIVRWSSPWAALLMYFSCPSHASLHLPNLCIWIAGGVVCCILHGFYFSFCLINISFRLWYKSLFSCQSSCFKVMDLKLLGDKEDFQWSRKTVKLQSFVNIFKVYYRFGICCLVFWFCLICFAGLLGWGVFLVCVFGFFFPLVGWGFFYWRCCPMLLDKNTVFFSGPYLCSQWNCSVRRWTWIHRLWVLSPFKILGRFRKPKNAELRIFYLILFGKARSGMASALLCFFWSMYLFWLSKAWIAVAKILHFLAKVQWQMASFTRCNI